MNDLLIFALLFLAIAIGWALGRRSAPRVISAPDLPSQYYKGLNYLLEDHPDQAVDAFIGAMEVNSETLETHLALGNLLRKRGEVDRAIRIHQNLLARPSLPRSQVHQAHLELARDYVSAGLLDRAERLLLDLVEESPHQRRTSQRHLLDIYQLEREWERAIEVACDLLPKKSLLRGSTGDEVRESGQDISVMLSHYYCELAAQKRYAGEIQVARELLHKSLEQDGDCTRASLMLGELELDSGNVKKAIRALQSVRKQDRDFIPETIDPLRKCYQAKEDDEALRTYLQECLQAAPSPELVLAMAKYIEEADGSAAAAAFLSSQLAERPSLRGLSRLISLQVQTSEGRVHDDLDLLKVLVTRLISERPAYRCEHCGFSGRQLHWFCPGCKRWGTIKPVRAGGAH